MKKQNLALIKYFGLRLTSSISWSPCHSNCDRPVGQVKKYYTLPSGLRATP